MTTNMRNKTIALLVAGALLIGAPSFGFELPKTPSLGGANKTDSSVNPGAVARDGRNALISFASAQVGLATALGGYEGLAAQQQLLAGLKSGDAAATKEQIDTAVNVSNSASAAINQKVATNAKITAENRTLALNSTIDYFNGLVASRKLVGSIQSLAANPLALGSDAGSILSLAKSLPSIVGGGVSSSGALLKYLSANGVDTTKAAAAANDLGK